MNLRLLSLVRRFGRDESGVFAVVFGLMAIVLIALGGATVDYVALDQARSRSQIALDAAALALQPESQLTGANKTAIQAKAQALVDDRIGGGGVVTINSTTINTTDGSLYFTATMKTPTIFVALVGVKEMSAFIQSEATRKKLSLEIAFVLDNSGSMAYTGTGTLGLKQRMQFLKDAATCATNILFYKDTTTPLLFPDTCVPATGAVKLDNVKIGVVPFTMFVNVGASNLNATWIDKGTSVTANDNFDDGRTPPGNINRTTLFTATKQSWKGCVEARPHIKTGTRAEEYLDTDDTVPLAGNTLFVPMFSPDVLDGLQGNDYMDDTPAICDRPAPAQCIQVQSRFGCNSSNGSCSSSNTADPVTGGTNASGVVDVLATNGANFTSSTKYPNGYYGAHASSCSCSAWTSYSDWTQTGGSGNNRTFTRFRSCNGGGYTPGGLTNRQLQERICKYYGTVTTVSDTRGPNADCGAASITPLTATPSTVTTAISNMVALGGTNIHEGAAWGFRALSPGAPFTEGGPYDQATSKVMILMTDGENTTYNLSNYCSQGMRTLNSNCYNSAYGYPYNSFNTDTASSSGGNIERLGRFGANNASLVTELNNRTVQTCANAKAAGITVYTIGLATSEASQSTQAVVEDMLTQCASTPDKAHFPQEPSELKDVFQQIANELTALRLSR
ncbi:MAG: pilus assembly protein TadG-related protein [Candidatus Devosia phytovorans]|uniref:Pilus assembly protein TadG-related protein n=1 Tax=Candidatus Devosia phytovorans TaxID=3121372 RepID=A0AAJ5VS08_9HYPH|nr:pilus assembly protein TadG-related protein [Devosia sp.]WEK03162.1 MAG: pilus assembly protein TadG-related protein [Devosia sp.]